jgi:alanine dehydrogenase
MSVLYLSEQDTRNLLTWPDVIACLAETYAAADDPRGAPPRVVARADGTWLRALTAISRSTGCMGAKLIVKGRPPKADHLIALWHRDSGALACLISAKNVTAMRTAGTSAVAVDAIAFRDRPLRLAVLGSGREAQSHVSAVATVRAISGIRVYSPTPENRERFARDCAGKLNIECRATDNPAEAVEGADLVLAAARSHDETPILSGRWLAPGMLVVSIGSTVPEQREVDADVIERAEAIVVDVLEEVAHETGDMIAAREAGVAFEHKLVTLGDVVRGRAVVRQRADNIVLFKSVGSGLQDIAVSGMCYERAVAAGAGTDLPMD